MASARLSYVLRLSALAAFYVVGAKFGFWLAATGGGYAAPVWPPSGIATAALAVWGRRYAPGVFLGAFLANFLVRGTADPQNLMLSATIGAGNTLEALVFLALLERAFDFDALFGRLEDVLGFLTASLAAPIVSATVGLVGLLAFSAAVPRGQLLPMWITWWVGDVLGALVLAPLLISLFRGHDARPLRRLKMSHYSYPLMFVFLAFLAYGSSAMPQTSQLFLALIVYSSLIWCALSLSLVGHFTAVLVVSGFEVLGAFYAQGPFGAIGNVVERLVLLQFFIGSTAATMMFLRAAFTERISALELAHQRELAMVAGEKLSALGAMTSGIAHEINNPLCVVYGKTSVARAHVESGSIEPAFLLRTLDQIESVAHRIEKIVSSIRFFSRDTELDPFKAVPLKAIIDDAIEICGDHFKQHRVDLIVDPIPETLELECKAVQVAQVLLNLLNNAHAAAAANTDRWVRLSATCSEQAIEIRVADSGPGIPLELRSKIFRPFFTTKPAGEGTGLGLSVSKSIVESHNGSIAIDPACAYTQFVVSLPLRQESRA